MGGTGAVYGRAAHSRLGFWLNVVKPILSNMNLLNGHFGNANSEATSSTLTGEVGLTSDK